jgi:hypothetical protein
MTPKMFPNAQISIHVGAVSRRVLGWRETSNRQ